MHDTLETQKHASKQPLATYTVSRSAQMQHCSVASRFSAKYQSRISHRPADDTSGGRCACEQLYVDQRCESFSFSMIELS